MNTITEIDEKLSTCETKEVEDSCGCGCERIHPRHVNMIVVKLEHHAVLVDVKKTCLKRKNRYGIENPYLSYPPQQ